MKWASLNWGGMKSKKADLNQGHPAREIASPKAPISAKFTVRALSFEHLHPFIRRFFARIDPKSLIKSVKLFPSWMALGFDRPVQAGSTFLVHFSRRSRNSSLVVPLKGSWRASGINSRSRDASGDCEINCRRTSGGQTRSSSPWVKRTGMAPGALAIDSQTKLEAR